MGKNMPDASETRSAAALPDWSAKEPDLNLLNMPFLLNDFSKLVHACGVVDNREVSGIHWVNINSIFNNTLRKRERLLQSKDERRRGVARTPSKKSHSSGKLDMEAVGYQGRSEVA